MSASSSAPASGRVRPVAKVLVATTAMLTFISFWRAAAIVLNDLASSAYYAGGEAEQFIGKTAPWFILVTMLLSYGVSQLYVESCSMFVRGGVYRVVKEAMGGTLAKFSVSALMFDYILTGPISGVSAGQYLAGLLNELLSYAHIAVRLRPDATAEIFAVAATLYFWWENTKGITESSEKALWIMQLTSVMVIGLIGWCGYTLLVRGGHLPPLPVPHNIILSPRSLGWLAGSRIASTVTLVAVFVGLGHSVLAMSGAESLAQVYREIEHPKLPNLKKAAFVIFVYSMIFTSLVSFFAVMIIPDGLRAQYFENLIGGLAMNLQGPMIARLVFHVFVVAVGTLILSGAVNTAIVGSNGVLNRVSEDGVLSDWFREPHPKFGTSYRIINIVVGLQILMIVFSRGNVTLLANLYAFGVIWSFVLNGISVLVLRYTQPNQREFKVPPNITIAGREIPIGVGLITLVLLMTAVVNLFTKPAATVSGVIFSALLFLGFTLSERHVQKGRGEEHVEVDKFNLAQSEELLPDSVGVRPGNILVPVSTQYTLYHLEDALRRAKGRRDEIVVLHVQMLKPLTVATDLQPDQMFSTIEQLLFTKVLSVAEREGKPVRLAVAAANDLWDGILRTAANLQSGTVVAGSSATLSVVDQAREIGIAWERMPDPRPRLTLEIFTPTGQEQIFYLGPHAPRLTPKEIDLLHKLWLEATDRLPEEELHHHDVVHFALNEFQRMIADGGGEEVMLRLRQHLDEIKTRRDHCVDITGPVEVSDEGARRGFDSLRLNPDSPRS
ncbi:MAG TPA: amino acid permease [Candidatus Acidoferrum sp.]|jgi:amino acid transporter|nr:amino acid permease [Candidatus Acidoferrum sp.]